MNEEIRKTREYLDYLQEHYDNVQKAWKIIQDKGDGKSFDFLYDDFKWGCLQQKIISHDKSKLGKFEFTQYRKKFFPTIMEKENDKGLIDQLFNLAWEHHKQYNDHHWETWSTEDNDNPNGFLSGCVVHNVCDWMAKGMKFNDTAKVYYEKNKKDIIIPKWAEKLMYEIFELVY